MTHAAIEQEILTYLHKLAPIQQEQVLNFVQKLAEAPPTGVPGAMLLPFAGNIEVAQLEAMTQAIEEGCEQVSPNEW